MWPENETMVAEGHSVWFKRITCADQPCENGGSCRDRPGYIHQYKCDCSQGWCGRRCEKLHYNVTRRHCILGGDISSKYMSSPEECLKWCLQTTGCKATGYSSLKYCHLELNDHTKTSLSYCIGYDYYYPLKECNNET
ncbi:sushi, nidogen and EGF-like domain-containing protein 1 [Limulus polyphemus]|uniref:Sushi, nidogen and EGF-like domain-containing protein 1 n=1 Tax=Limulus polyphemus TaxID=6850 RepID=A0ABM1S862_LIMPO|nr:sushi, nidogen and EGF-like domain-containing protein 1 [Limulus polyphemus]